MSLKAKFAKMFKGSSNDGGRLEECIEAGILKVAQMGHVPTEEIRADFMANLAMMGISYTPKNTPAELPEGE